jgi:hypothetical protein
MPRKSAASLSVVPRVPGKGRPEPPVDLDVRESRIWREEWMRFRGTGWTLLVS